MRTLRDLFFSSNEYVAILGPPRPSSGDTSVMEVATVLSGNVTLQFTAWKYLDEPNNTQFTWFKENKTLLENGIKYITNTNGLQTILSIRNTTTDDLGLYRLYVNNSAGEYIHFYDLTSAGKSNDVLL